MQTVIEQSSIIICSYGHLTYEAMALGKAMCVVAKKFSTRICKSIREQKFVCLGWFGDKLNTIDLKKMLTIKKNYFRKTSKIKFK